MSEWIAGWGYRQTDFSLFPICAENETQRLWFCVNLFSAALRLRFSNRYGREALPLAQVTVGLCTEMGELLPGTAVKVRFDGREAVTLDQGEIRYCDAIDFRVKPGDWVCVSVYIEKRVRVTGAISSQSRRVTGISCQKGGNFCNARSVAGERFLDEAREFMALKPLYNIVAVALTQAEFLCQGPGVVTTVAVFGDSITQHGNWSEPLTQRLYAAAPGCVAVVNCGICGNRVLHDASIRSKFGGYFGEGGLERFEEDVYQTPEKRVDCVIVQEGINDIIQPYDKTCPQYETVTAEEILSGYQRMADIAHAHGTRILGANLMPFRGFNAVWNADSEGVRRTVNQALAKGGIFDAVLDFAGILRDDAAPERIARKYNCADNLHPNAKGGQALADSVDLALILGSQKGEFTC